MEGWMLIRSKTQVGVLDDSSFTQCREIKTPLQWMRLDMRSIFQEKYRDLIASTASPI